MNTYSEVSTPIPELVEKYRANGPVASARMRRFNIGYAVMCLFGLMPSVLGWSESMQAFGWGLWFPGAGFIALGGWAPLATALTIILFGLAFIAWFGSGMIVAPVIVWLGAAAIAGASVGDTVWPAAYWLVPTMTVAILLFLTFRARRDFAQQLGKCAERNAYLPAAYRAMRAAQTQQPEQIQHELDITQLEHLRWVLDRALQPIGELNGFTKIDQFQTSALRYQLNFAGYTLALAQRHYTPNFHGYMSEAQRRLIEQMLQPKVCNYWRLENAWGNLTFDADPVGKDNIMLTGYFGLQVCLYMNNTGDRRYEEPGSLTFKVSEKLQFPHDIHSINQSLLDNYDRNYDEYCLYPCEPNWIYPACNLYGASSLTAYDVVFDTNHFGSLREQFTEKLETEFVTPAGGIVPLRSQLTGHALPFPAPDPANVLLTSPTLPELAERYWTIARHENIHEEDGALRVELVDPHVDFGNYTRSSFLTFESLLAAATELGDDAASTAIQAALDTEHGVQREDGRRYYKASTLANMSYVRTVIGFKNAWRDAVSTPIPETALTGPLLQDVNYPDTLVARAVSNGSNLEMVLVATGESGVHKLSFARLSPGQTYSVTGENISEELVSDNQGKATLEIPANGRQQLELSPRKQTPCE